MLKEQCKLLYRLAFGKTSMAIFIGKNLLAAVLCVCSASNMHEAFWLALPWVGTLTIDILWYSIPLFVRLSRKISFWWRS
jgi:hypothetical protein